MTFTSPARCVNSSSDPWWCGHWLEPGLPPLEHFPHTEPSPGPWSSHTSESIIEAEDRLDTSKLSLVHDSWNFSSTFLLSSSVETVSDYFIKLSFSLPFQAFQLLITMSRMEDKIPSDSWPGHGRLDHLLICRLSISTITAHDLSGITGDLTKQLQSSLTQTAKHFHMSP